MACLITPSERVDSGGGVLLSVSHLQAVDTGRLSNYMGVGFVRSGATPVHGPLSYISIIFLDYKCIILTSLVEPEESSEVIKNISVLPLGTMKIHSKFNRNVAITF